MELTEQEEALVMAQIRSLFKEQEMTPGFVVETSTDIDFEGGITLRLSMVKSDSSK